MQFSLVPFEPTPDIPNLQGIVTRDGQKLHIEFKPLPLNGIVWPTTNSQQGVKSKRKDNLWQTTCFECFFGTPDSDSYIEINASPNGNWQAYRFNSYRELTSTHDKVSVQVQTNIYSSGEKSIALDIEFHEPPFVTPATRDYWNISISVVLERESGDHLYFAGSHPQDKPDFHLSELRALAISQSDSPGSL